MITFRHKGNFSKSKKYFTNVKKAVKSVNLDKYGKEGVAALASATPVRTGLTASSWSYEIQKTNDSTSIVFNNSNRQNGVLIAIILYYGHGTGTGGWVEGRDYISPAIQPLFDKLAKDAWEEVTKL